MNAQVKVHRNAVVIYYSKNSKKTYFNTGCKIKNIGDFDGMEFNKTVNGYILNNKIIRDKLGEIQKLIDNYHVKNQDFPSVEWLKNEYSKVVEKPKEGKDKIKSVYDEFMIKYKQKHPHSTVRNYICVGNIINDFCELKKYKYMSDIKEEFMIELDIYLMGRFRNTTGKKRYAMIKYFLKSVKKKYHLPTEVFDVKSSLKYKPQKEIVYFKIDELKQLKNLKNLTKDEEKTRDIMLFLCYTGLRISDAKRVVKEMISIHKSKNGNNIPVLELYTQKTNEKVEIPLNPTAQEILEKHNYNIGVVEQTFNDNIKALLKKQELCLYKIAIDSTKKNDTTTDFVEKYKCISSKTGRKTFISLMVINKVSLNNIMSCTGHKQLEILVMYMAKLLDKELEFTGILDETYTPV
ncbi:MAG: hypothetical protein M0R16_05405 [Bacteroidales bacterium]|jgi:integrase|nr:hypothetical protein [Bacteroidales bacterium]